MSKELTIFASISITQTYHIEIYTVTLKKLKMATPKRNLQDAVPRFHKSKSQFVNATMKAMKLLGPFKVHSLILITFS